MEMHQKDLTWWLDLACHTSTGCQEPWMAVTAFILDILPDLLLFSVFIPALPEIFNVCFLRLSIFASVRVLFNRFILERTLFFGKNKSDLNNFWSGNLAEREDWQAWTSAESSRWRTRCAAASPRSRTHWKLSIPSRRQRNTFTRTGRWHKWLNSKRCRGSMPP